MMPLRLNKRGSDGVSSLGAASVVGRAVYELLGDGIMGHNESVGISAYKKQYYHIQANLEKF